MHFFTYRGKIYGLAEAQKRAYVMETNGWASPVYWTWQEISVKDFEIIQEIAEREQDRLLHAN